MGTYYSEAISCPLHVPIAVSAHVRIACNKLPVGGPPAEALDGGRALLGPFARVRWRVKSDEPKD